MSPKLPRKSKKNSKTLVNQKKQLAKKNQNKKEIQK